MMSLERSPLLKCLQGMVCLLILVVTFKIVAIYVDYFPPNFSADFLIGRKPEFYGSYQWAFYTHILTGPFTLIFGMILLSDRFRIRFRRWHSRIGKAQVALILLFLVPSGFWMAFYAQSDFPVKLGFATLSVVTGLSAALGWWFAVNRDFHLHRLWMKRCYVLLCSAVVTRVVGGALLTSGVESEWTNALPAWINWIIPLVLFEIINRSTTSQSALPRQNKASLGTEAFRYVKSNKTGA
ncbi:DUF2306 domain-containing protein [Thalassoglobus polymorphus]|uniref:Membrane protein (DUF2306) n=1 Tax=Thalassoglobus polymorphus TaxID=2527994 RepID=A0A517QVF6_9PLAN|nr:DUF2306 domain-containing protein [Thalassoglobus polymorphus]QDT35616.1 hypothetical protein Mal48_48940 [Thalassoglobus polymorphus]